MDLNSALDIIIRDLREAREIIGDLRNYKGVPVIQVELARSKCKSAEEIITLLKTIYPKGTVEQAEVTPVEEKRAEVTPVAEKPVTLPEPEKPLQEKRVIEEKTLDIEETVSSLSEPGTTREAVTPAAVEEAAPKAKRPSPRKGDSGKSILADRFGEVENRINEKMHGRKSDDDISSRMKQSPITNLADAIGINDKFYFIREIFGGNNQTYSTAIGKLNNASGVKEAENIIMEICGNEADPAAIKELLGLVKRKTGSDG